MICSKCGTENRSGAKFCNECGNKFEIACSNCGNFNPPASKFCDECGTEVSAPAKAATRELSFDEKIEKIQRYLPRGLTEKILAQRDRIEGERKQVTVMFCDMEGFTALTEKLGPEEAYTIMDQVYEILIHKVHDYEGTVNEMTGDGILALFGAPIAKEDAPQRAIRSACAIHRELTEFNERMRRDKTGLPSLKMRIGIHTGPVVVGTLGNDLRVEFKAVGNTVNLASRVEGLAAAGTTFVTEDTFKLTEGFFRFEAVGDRQVKGKEDPVAVYQVIAPSTRRTRFDVSAERGLTPFVGRDRELELLLDGYERAKSGRGQAFSIMAEAGLGKSRLLYEFRKAVANEDLTFLEGKCLSYNKSVAYHPVIDILKSIFDVRDDEKDVAVCEKVSDGLKNLRIDVSSALPYLLELLGVKDSGLDRLRLSSEARKERIIETAKITALKGSEIRPVVIAFEDLHWSDKGTADYLKFLLDGIAGSRVFLIFTYRPEFVPAWGGKSYHNQVNLNRLSNRECQVMIRHLLGATALDIDLEELVLEKTEGVPFFIEEFLKSLKDLKIIEKGDGRYHLARNFLEVTIPSTIQDVIMARVDALPERTKDVLQTCSVIEREFDYKLINLVAGFPEPEMLSCLSALKDAELLYERGIYPESIFIFKHALTREVVYDSILANRKRRLHGRVGNAIEEMYQDQIGNFYEVLVGHFIASENYEKAARYSKLAAKKAEKKASLNAAIVYARKRVDAIDRLPQDEDRTSDIIEARVVLALYYSQMNYFVEAKEAVDPILDLSAQHGNLKMLAQIYGTLGAYYYWVDEDFSEAFDHLQKALTISEKIGNVLSVFFANFWLGMGLSLTGEFQKSHHHLEKALQINVQANSLWGESLCLSAISFFVHFYRGDVVQGFRTSEEALNKAEDSGDIFSKAAAYTYHGISCYSKGLMDKAESFLLKGSELCERIKFFSVHALAENLLARVYMQTGEFQKSEMHHDKEITIFENYNIMSSWKILAIMSRSRLSVSTVMDSYHKDILFDFLNRNRVKIFEGILTRYLGEFLLNSGSRYYIEAEKCLSKAIELDKRFDMNFYLAKDHAAYALLHKNMGKLQAARENFEKSIDIFKQCGADGWVERYEKELAALQ